jgi:hypothetical protein
VVDDMWVRMYGMSGQYDGGRLLFILLNNFIVSKFAYEKNSLAGWLSYAMKMRNASPRTAGLPRQPLRCKAGDSRILLTSIVHHLSVSPELRRQRVEG